MARGNLKGLNPDFTAQNSLNRPAAGHSTNELSNKRRRVGSSPVRLPEGLPIQIPKSKSGDSELYDFKSTTDGGDDSKQPSRATQQQFRSTQAHNGPRKKRRLRTSRQSKSAGASSQASPPIDLDESPTSPDPLVGGQPPSNITSDVAPSRGHTKRSRLPSFSESDSKRARAGSTRREAIDSVPDELALGEKSKFFSRNPRPQSTTTGHERRSPARGDIKPTIFSSPKTKPQPRAKKIGLASHIEGAVSGSLLVQSTPEERYSFKPSYDADGEVDRLHLLLEKVDTEENPVEILKIEEAIATCMTIDFRKLKSAHYHAKNSAFLAIDRPISPGQGQSLVIKFSSVTECAKFIEFLPATKRSPVKQETKDLEKTFNHTWQAALKRLAQPKAETPTQKQPSENSRSGKGQFVVEIPSRQQTRSKARLIDQMSGIPNETKEEKVTSDLADAVRPSTPAREEVIVRSRRSTMYSANGRSSAPPEPSIIRWTEVNPDWEKRWSQSLVYPPTGKNRTVVDADDIPRLDDGECLNDNIINFYLRWIKMKAERENPGVLKKVHIFESYFFERLKKSKYQGVRNWTTKMDLLSYDYIVVPVNESFHWYLAIICNVAKALPHAGDEKDKEQPAVDGELQKEDSCKITVVQERVKAIALDDEEPAKPSSKTEGSDPYCIPETPPPGDKEDNPTRSKGKKSKAPPPQKFDPNEPRIITLDSLGSAHSPTCRILREYLAEEAMDKKNVSLETGVPGMTAKGIPLQGNAYDCGTYTLAFIEKFLGDPVEVSRQLLQKEDLDWDVDSATMRVDVRELLFTLQDEQKERLKQEAAEKRQRRRSKSVANGAAMSSPGPVIVPMASQETSRKAASKTFASSPTNGQASVDIGDSAEAGGDNRSSPVVCESLGKERWHRLESIEDDNPRLISPLLESEDITNSAKPSAAVSPSHTTPIPKASRKSRSTALTSSSGIKANPPFIQEIPSSSSEREEDGQETKKLEATCVKAEKEAILPSIEQGENSVQPSVEQDDEKPRTQSSSFISNVSDMAKGFFGVKKRAWSGQGGKKRASYDGIDRS